MSVLKDIQVSEPLSILKSTLMDWVDRVEMISNSFPQSQDKYYLESTLVSLLAGAAWSNEIQAGSSGSEGVLNSFENNSLHIYSAHTFILELKVLKRRFETQNKPFWPFRKESTSRLL